MHTEFCVDTTTRKALALGYPVVLVSDAHTSAGNAAIGPQQVIAHHNVTLTNISSFGPKVTAIAHDAIRFLIDPKSGSYPIAMSWFGGNPAGAGKVIRATT